MKKTTKKDLKKSYDDVLSTWKKQYVCSCGESYAYFADYHFHQTMKEHRNGHIFISVGFIICSCAIFRGDVK